MLFHIGVAVGTGEAPSGELADLNNAYADLLDEHVTMWSNFVMHRAPMYASPIDGAVGEDDEIPLLLEGAIHGILAHCREALADLG